MTPITENLITSIAHLPNGAITHFNGVSWEEYEGLLSQMESQPATRLWYDNGKLSIKMPNPKHEKYKTFFHRIGQILAEEFEVDIEDLGSTTYKSEMRRKGIEPDACFYIQSAKFIIGLDDFDTSSAPPPDVVLEIDITNDSWDKFKIYASFEVPEIWRYDGNEVKFYQIVEEKYETIENSKAFEILTSEVLSEFIERSKREGQTAILKEFRAWVKKQI